MGLNQALKAAKNTVALFLGTLGRMVASFLFVLFVASELDLERFSKYSLVVFYFELLLSLTSTAVGILLTRDLARWKRSTNHLFTSAVSMTLVLDLVAPVVLLLCCFLFGYAPDTSYGIVLSSLVLVPASICAILEAFSVAYERAEHVTLGLIIESFVRIPLSIALIAWGYHWTALVWAMLVSKLVQLAFLAWCSRSTYELQISVRWSSLKRFAFRWRTFAGENWMATLYTNLDVLVLSVLVGETAVGLYSAAWKVVRLGSILAKSYTTAIFPVMAKMYGQSKDSFAILYEQTLRAMAVIAMPAIIGVMVLADALISMMFEPEFSEATAILRVLIWALLVEFLNPFLSHALFAQGKQHLSMRVAGISLSVNAVLTFALVYGYGATGAALGTIVGGLVATVCYSIFLMERKDLVRLVLMILRVLVAASVAGCLLLLLDESWFGTNIAIAVVAYGILLLLLGVLRVRDFQELKSLILERVKA